MLIKEFILALISLLSNSYASYLVFREIRKTPLQLGKEMPIHDTYLYKKFDMIVNNVRQYIPL